MMNGSLNDSFNRSFNRSFIVNNSYNFKEYIYNIFLLMGIGVIGAATSFIWIGYMVHLNIKKEHNNRVGYDSDSETDSETDKEYEK